MNLVAIKRTSLNPFTVNILSLFEMRNPNIRKCSRILWRKLYIDILGGNIILS